MRRFDWRLWVAFAVCTFALTSVLSAQQFPSQQRGLGAATAFAAGDVDSINLFNGNLVVRIPLGGAYPVGPALSYGLSLVYNSYGWDSSDAFCTNTAQLYDLPVADPEANAGFGWSLHLGKIVEPDSGIGWTYVGPDGGQHGFYPRLHPGYPATPQSNVWYSNDSTYLRLRYFPTGSPLCESPAGVTSECHRLEFPDGTVHEFRNYDAADGDHRLVAIRDPFGHAIDVTFPAGGTTWEIHDEHGRVQTVHYAGPAGAYDRVTQVDVEAFGGAGSGNVASYTLSHTPTLIERQRLMPPPGCQGVPAAQISAQLLTRLTLPDGSFYDFDYYATDNVGDVLSGGMARLRLATGGAFGYTYEVMSFRSQDPVAMDFEGLNIAFGVDEKQLFVRDSDVAPIGTWSYAYERSTVNAPGDSVVPCHHATVVTDPLGHDTVHYFSSSSFLHRWSYGLPFTRCDPSVGAYSNVGPFLSQEVFDGSATSGTKLRSMYVEYGSDGPLMGEPDKQDKNHRLDLRRTVFHDDGDRFAETTFDDFDGVGHFRDQATDGNFGVGDVRTATTNWNPARGTLVVNPETSATNGSTFSLPALGAPWLFTTFREQRVSENGAEAIVEHCFDEATGYLARSRVLAGPTRAGGDLLTIFVPEQVVGQSTGRVASERLYGGDEGGVLDNVYGNLCQMSLPTADPRYQTDHIYAAGVLRRSAAIDPCDDSEVLVTLDVDIDASTGLVATSRDPAGVETDFVFDTMGRLVAERPAESAWSSTEYRLPTTAQPSLVTRVTGQACANGVATCSGDGLLGWRRQLFDGLGRLEESQLRSPEISGIVTNRQVFTYDPLGRAVAASVWDDTSLETETTYDRFGRPTRIDPPNHPANPATLISYEGVRTVTRRQKVATGAGGAETDVYTTEISDRQGRLDRVCEDRGTPWAGSCSGGTETRYEYDVGSRLSRVCQNASGASCGQTRDFEYDQRGFLLRERHPEVGPTGNGWTDYTYDAAGNVLTRRLAGSTQFDLDYAYDAVGRLIRVDENDSGSPRPLKEFRYGRNNQGADKRRGKLVQTQRHNWVDIVTPLENPGTIDIVVSEQFRYEGKDGGVSSRQTRYFLPFGSVSTTYAWDTGFTWDDVGNLASVAYPRCLHASGNACAGTDPARTVGYGYSRGFLRSVTGFAPQIDYQSGGMLHRVGHANGVTDTVEIDPADGLRRPSRISTSAGWDSGLMSYDGTGNITAMGSRGFRYDRLGRMVSGEVDAGVGVGDRLQTALYDVYGNLTQLVTAGVSQPTPASTATNRLTLPGTLYDGAGNLTRFQQGGETYQYTYDGVSMMKYLVSNTDQARIFVYTADDERLVTLDCVGPGGGTCAGSGARETWTLRDLGGNVLRVVDHRWAQPWSWRHDYVYRDGAALAVVEPDGQGGEEVRHLHLDHLGSARQITNENGTQAAYHAYFPYGAEATNPAQDTIDKKFTGHERDENGSGSKGMLDYMHARHCSPILGRFLSFDPIGGNPSQPQSWNRYAYVLGNPVNNIDPLGLIPRASFNDSICVSASGSPCGFVSTSDSLLQSAFNFGALGLRSNTVSSAPAARSVVELARSLPQVGCEAGDASCGIIGGVGSAAPFARVVETGVITSVSLFLTAPSVFGPIGVESLTAASAGGLASRVLPRSGLTAQSLGAMSRADHLARKFGLNVNSPTTRQVLNSLDETVGSFVGQFRRGSINRELPSEVLNMTVEQALRHGSKVRKLLTSKRFAK